MCSHLNMRPLECASTPRPSPRGHERPHNTGDPVRTEVAKPPHHHLCTQGLKQHITYVPSTAAIPRSFRSSPTPPAPPHDVALAHRTFAIACALSSLTRPPSPVHACVCVYACLHAYTRVCARRCVHVCLCVFVCLSVSVCLHMCICICICMYI